MKLKPLLAALLASALLVGNAAAADVSLLNVSYDPTREFYQAFNAAFAKHWKARPATPSPSTSRTAAPASRRGR
jgi:ABC-type sulfate transport system substrate-binding protein